MMEHIILKKAFRYGAAAKDKRQDGYNYNSKLGFWTDNSNRPAIRNIDFQAGATKKCDVETGEDEKGE